MSADGNVVVGYHNIPGGQDAFRWTRGTGAILIDDFPGGRNLIQAFDVSADGSVVVGAGTPANGSEAFRWMQQGGVVGLGDLPGGEFASVAYGASTDGSVIVGYGVSANGLEAFRWTFEHGMVGLGDLPTGGFYSEANDVSADGSVVVGVSAGRNPFYNSAFRWAAESGMIEIPPTAAGAWAVTAEALSADGSVIVGGTNNVKGAFAWDPYHGTRAVADLLLEQGVDITGWELGIARGISGDGLAIVGQGVPPGTRQQQAWALRLDAGTFIPEPGSIVLGAVAVLMAVGWWRRRGRVR